MSFDILVWILEQKNDWGIIIFQFLCVGLYCCWRIFSFLYLLFLFFFDGPSSLRLRACMISKAMRWCFQHLQFFFSNIILMKFVFYVFHHRSTFNLNCLSFLSFIQQHLIIAAIEDNLRHLVGPYPNYSHISSLNILSLFFLLFFICNFNLIIVWTFDDWDKSELGICI